MTLISRVLGFVRDVVIARAFGAGASTDAFFVAFKIPNYLRRLFAEGAFSQAFVPVLSEYKTKRDHAAVAALADRVTGTLAWVLFLVTAAGILLAPFLIMLFAPGYVGVPEKYDMTVSMLRVTFPYLFFISLTALAGGILNTFGRFAVPAFTPVFLNICMIAAAVWLAPRMDKPVTALAWGVLAAGIIQLAFQVPFLLRLKVFPRPRVDFHDPGVKRILNLMLPALFGVSVTQINLMVDNILASFLPTGSISWIYYADRMIEFPLGGFAIALSTAILPSLSEKHAEGKTEKFSQTLDWALRWTLLIGLPASVGLAALAGPVLVSLFQYGEFSAHDVEMTRRALIPYTIGLMAFTTIKVLAPGFYSRQDTRTPVRAGVAAMLTNIVLSTGLMFYMAHAGLTLGTSLAACVNGGLLFWHLRRDGIYRPGPGWWAFMFRIALANLAMGAVLMYGDGDIAHWLHGSVWQRMWHLSVGLVVAVWVYAATLIATGLRWRDLDGHLPMRRRSAAGELAGGDAAG